MFRLLVIVVITLISVSLYQNYTNIDTLQPESVEANVTPDKVTPSSKRYLPNGTIVVSKSEMKLIDQAIEQNHKTRNYKDIFLPDNTRVPVKYNHSGKICSRTNLPIMTMTINGLVVE